MVLLSERTIIPSGAIVMTSTEKQYFSEIRSSLTCSWLLKCAVIRELRSHYEDAKTEDQRKSPQEVLGDPAYLAFSI